MAVEDSMILKAVHCLGASHMMNHMSSSDTEASIVADEKQRWLQETEYLQSSRATALQDLDSGTEEKRMGNEALLGSYLLLYLYELSEGTSDESWQLRLEGARSIVFNAWEEQQSESEEDDEEDGRPDREELEELGFDSFLVQFFLYHDIFSSVTVQRPKSSLISCRQEDTSFPPKDGQKEHMFRVHSGLIDNISRIASLRSDATAAPVLPATVSLKLLVSGRTSMTGSSLTMDCPTTTATCARRGSLLPLFGCFPSSILTELPMRRCRQWSTGV